MPTRIVNLEIANNISTSVLGPKQSMSRKYWTIRRQITKHQPQNHKNPK